MRCSALTDMGALPSFSGTTIILDADKMAIDDVREMVNSPVFRYVINSAEMLKAACVSALLKIVEEGASTFVFVCRNIARLAPALLSRCVRSYSGVQKYVSTTDLFASMPEEVSKMVKQGLGIEPAARFSVYHDKFSNRLLFRGFLVAYANKALFNDVLPERWARIEQVLFSEVGFNKYALWYVLGGKRK